MGPQEVIWIAGAAGRMGQAIEHHLDHARYIIMTTDAELDITDLEAVNNYVDTYRPDVVINCAGLSSKELAEQEAIKSPDPTRTVERLQPYRDRVSQHERNLQAIAKELSAMR